jgi:hypothetical protein
MAISGDCAAIFCVQARWLMDAVLFMFCCPLGFSDMVLRLCVTLAKLKNMSPLQAVFDANSKKGLRVISLHNQSW